MADIRSSLFGRLALDTGLVSLDQVQECVSLQVEYEKAGKRVPRLGELLASKGYLTPDQVRDILRKQKSNGETVAPEKSAPPPDPVKEVAQQEESASESARHQGPDSFGSFQIIKRLGRDASGYTYKAKYLPKDLAVTLRVLSKEKMQQSPDYVKRFEEQVKRATELKHPGIQRVVAAGRQHGRDYYAAQFVEGISLKRVLEARGKLDIPFALDITVQIAKALEYGHARGIYHSELRPSNVLITPDRRAMLIAYGVAHDVIGNLERLAESAAEMPFYIAPEQAIQPEKGGKCDARTDIYALGTVLYHMITGQPPFKGDSVKEVLLSLAEEDVADPTLLNPEVNQDLANITLSMMNPEPDNRYQTATHLLQDLERLVAEYSQMPPAPSESGTGFRPASRRGGTGTRPAAVMNDTQRARQDSSTVNRRNPTTVNRSAAGVVKAGKAGRGGGERRGRGRIKHGKEDTNVITMIVGIAVLVVAFLGILVVILSGDKTPPATQPPAAPTPQVQPQPRPQPPAPRPTPAPAPQPDQAPEPDSNDWEPSAPVAPEAPPPEKTVAPPAPEPADDDEEGQSRPRGLFGLEVRD